MLSLKQAVDALNDKYPDSAIGAFNFNDMTDMQGVMYAAQHTRQPCIMMASAGAVGYMGIHFVREMYQAARMTSAVPLYLMLDHAESVETCAQCIDNGFSLVMYDGSALPFAENVRNTREVLRMAHARGVLVEAEIARLPGREKGEDVAEALFTDPKEAKAFWEETGVDLLAISLGTTHGSQKSRPCVNFEVIKKIPGAYRRTARDAWHGRLPDEDVRQAIACGVKKVNVGTELQHAFVDSLRDTLDPTGHRNRPAQDPRSRA